MEGTVGTKEFLMGVQGSFGVFEDAEPEYEVGRLRSNWMKEKRQRRLLI